MRIPACESFTSPARPQPCSIALNLACVVQQLQQMVADAVSKVPALRQPTPDALTAALKDVALYKSPGFYVLEPEYPQVMQDIDKIKVQPDPSS